MKTNKSILLGAAALGAIASGVYAQPAGILNSEHNFSGNAWSQGQVCLPCHTPHHAMEGMPRLWNHELTTATYQMHGTNYGPTNGGTGITIGPPFTAETNFDTVSRMCLSCHDGTVALDSFGGNTGTTFLAAQSRANLGTDLEDDHPVGSDGIYFANGTVPNAPSFWSGAFQPATGTTFGNVGSLRLKDFTWSGTAYKVVGCTTCHNPHNRYGGEHMLAMAGNNSASSLCLTCHIK